jgi:CRP-like cAMP-binding protein
MGGKQWLSPAVRAVSSIRRLAAGQALFHAGDHAAGIYEVIAGAVRLVRIDKAGRETILQVGRTGETLAEASLFSTTYHCEAIAMTEAAARLYPKAALLAEFERDPKLARAFMAMLARQVMNLRARLEQRNVRSARGRIRQYLASHTGDDGRTVALTGTLKHLAGEIGLTHETLYRTLSEMAAAREIERSKGKIRIVAPRSV